MIRLERIDYTLYNQGSVSTIKAADGNQPYETAILDPNYSGSFICVEAYGTKQQALDGHAKWLAKMASGNPPSKLTDVENGFWGSLKGLSGDISYDRKTI